jgi:hypothetical protein
MALRPRTAEEIAAYHWVVAELRGMVRMGQMPALSNPRWEKFCQTYVRGKTAGDGTESYLAAGFKCSRKAAGVAASRLLKNASIKQRIAELQGQVAQIEADAVAEATKKHALTVDSLIEEADKLLKAGLEHKQIGAAVSALVAKAKIAGLWIERADVRNPDLANTVKTFVDRPPRETREEWIARRNRELAGMGKPPLRSD